MTPKTIRAAGGVLWRPAEGRRSSRPAVEIGVIHRPRYDDWTLPKGKLLPGESDIEGAVREVREETGHRVRLGRALGEVRYTKGTRYGPTPKIVRYWAMQTDGGNFVAGDEVDELRWLPLDGAAPMLSHERDRQVLDRFLRGPALLKTVLLVRHASAGSRSHWEGDDRARPLDERGRDQADALVSLLSRFKVREVSSADFVRCVATLRPLADAVGRPVKEEPLFSETGYQGREPEAVATIRDLGSPYVTVAVCSQGDVIPDLLRRLADEDHVELPEPIPHKKASVWILSFDDHRLFSADYIRPPVSE